jgi:hypothetical protein
VAFVKTQTRRVVKLPEDALPHRTMVDPGNVPIFGPGPYVKAFHMEHGEELMYPRIRCPYGYPGGKLWVREAWKPCWTDGSGTEYKADERGCSGPWKPSIHMHRHRSRITLEIAAVRAERLQDISEADAKAEGVAAQSVALSPGITSYKASYIQLWDELNAERNGGQYAWAANPLVWVVTFRRVPA